ncbi:hypothetical protein [Alicyclobacillus fastidiosus]|uniref:Uncharacterized protein n=1 Tax=Alicyclobacillus fastidiosus TaxID=392011 RepID=A0ABV5A9T2_9BACL|nr:hypothetical protein [Alicyclobacillus fastidiosus]WEH10948.1 hypothetical protein PYS47_06955 [Alicyclobacillus fastidiosus]
MNERTEKLVDTIQQLIEALTSELLEQYDDVKINFSVDANHSHATLS